ncbi:YbaK family protein [Bacillus sp. Marseille-P3661]|uniref:YbaK family protein n=1 Tax=Bacillus sp. Marseille-P3661 TaxID=1936234 RepID=UPI000C844F64|nr:YbaK family protein [Bacillus sp. Marseille-P3661]
MNVITTFKEKRHAKQIAFEHKLLRELSLKSLKEKVKLFFSPFFKSNSIYATAIEDGSVDMAIEAYLLGAKMSRFGYFGETEDQVRQRCYKEEQYLIDNLFDYLQYWGATGGNDLVSESLFHACEQYIGNWWKEGFRKGELRYRLRLH